MLLLLIISKLGLKPHPKLDGFNCKVWELTEHPMLDGVAEEGR